MKLTTTIWLVFVLCLLAVLAAMGWLSATALRLDRAEIEARRQAAVEEKVRLALWRMDSALAPLVAQESARPYFAYLPYFPAERAYSRMFNARTKGETMLASPLLTETPPRILLHFQFDAAGRLTSPQLPPETNRNFEQSLQRDAATQESQKKDFDRLQKLTSGKALASSLPEPKSAPLTIVYPPGNNFLNTANRNQVANNSAANVDQQNAAQQQRLANSSPASNQLKGLNASQQPEMPRQEEQSRQEFAQRAQAVQQSANVMVQGQQAINQPMPLPSPSTPPGSPPLASQPPANTDFSGVLMTPLWIDGELILARRVLAGGEQFVQGCLLDWPAIRSWLLDEIADLLPDADLQPARASDTAEQSRLLAALPILLVPGKVAVDGETNWSPLVLSLLAAWICLFLTAAAIAGLLSGVMRLSTRRASFVTAVTHELRTPLTTFQMYAEMLAEGMVPEESQRKQYLHTLRAEAVRLTHLVENVLAYARLERGRLDRRLETVPLGDLIGSMQGRLADRAAQAGMEFVVENGEKAEHLMVKTNISAVEQILFNLVDNACKYASADDDKRILLSLQEKDGQAAVQVADRGPGIAPEMRRRLFRSFSKTAKEAAHSAPGVGLGLALSRRLARDLGGELTYFAQSTPGACFVLTLPLA